MWKSKSVRDYIIEIESENAAGLHKKDVLKILVSRWNDLKDSKTQYESQGSKTRERPAPRKVTVSDSQNEVFGMCPVASEKTVCCNLMTIDAVQGCSLGCSYCSIQTFYTDGKYP